MALKVDSQLVDERVISAWKSALKNANATELQTFAAKHPNLTAGFRKGKVSLSALVPRIQALLDQSGDLPVDLCVLLRNATLSRTLLCVLSEKAIHESLPLLPSAFGRLNIFSAMLLDERESIRKLGFDQIASLNAPEPTDQEQKESIQSLQNLFKTFFDQMQLLTGKDVPSTTELVTKRDRKTRKLVVDLRQKRQEANRLRRDLLDAQSDRYKVRLQNRALSDSLTASETALQTKSQAYNKLSIDFEERVEQAVCRQLDARVLPWLRPAEALSQAVAKSAQCNLLQEAEALLLRQATADQRFGLRSQLEAEGRRYGVVIERLKDAIRESIRPLPEIGSAVRKMETRVAEIEKLLKQSSQTATEAGQAPPPLVEKLQQALTLDEVATVRKGLLAIDSVGLLAPRDLEAAYVLIGDVASRLYMQASLGNKKISLKGVPLYALQRQLAEGRECTMLVDGHNVLHKLPTIFGVYYEHGDPGSRAQEALVQKLDLLCSRQEDLTVELWFDSGVAHDETLKENFNVHYSGGQGVNRADDQIVAYLQYLKREGSPRLRALVTADRDEAAKAEACGALIISPQEFAVLVR